MNRGTALGLAAGCLADVVVGDPRRGHPVAAYGQGVAALERRVYRDDRWAGVMFTVLAVGAPVGLAVFAQVTTSRRPVLRAALTAAATWAVLGGTGLAREGAAMADLIDSAPIADARERLSHLCGRDPSRLDAAGLTRAATESVAENTSDAVVAPLFWGAIAGLPGLLGYRAVNTLDAMVGHRTPRYERFGWASARLDDVVNWAPARICAAAAALCAPALRAVDDVGLASGAGGNGGLRAAVLAWRRDAAQHPSPNAGPVEAAFAGALGVRLGGVNDYGGRREDRGTLGDGPPPSTSDLRAAVRLSRVVGAVAALGAVAVAWRCSR